MRDKTEGKTQHPLWWLVSWVWHLTLGLFAFWLLYSSQVHIQVHEDLLNQLEELTGEENAQEWMVVNAELLAQVQMQIQRVARILGRWVLWGWVLGTGLLSARFWFKRRTAQQRLHVHQTLKPLSRLSRWLPEDKREEWLGDFYEARAQWHRQGYAPLAIRRRTLKRARQLVIAGIRYRIYNAVFARKAKRS